MASIFKIIFSRPALSGLDKFLITMGVKAPPKPSKTERFAQHITDRIVDAGHSAEHKVARAYFSTKRGSRKSFNFFRALRLQNPFYLK